MQFLGMQKLDRFAPAQKCFHKRLAMDYIQNDDGNKSSSTAPLNPNGSGDTEGLENSRQGRAYKSLHERVDFLSLRVDGSLQLSGFSHSVIPWWTTISYRPSLVFLGFDLPGRLQLHHFNLGMVHKPNNLPHLAISLCQCSLKFLHSLLQIIGPQCVIERHTDATCRLG